MFEGEVQTLAIEAGARTAPPTTPNFTVISMWNKAVC